MCSVDYASSYSTELQYHVRKASGAELRIVPESQRPESGACVFSGATKLACEAGVEVPADTPNAFVIQRIGNSLFILDRKSCRFRVWVKTSQDLTGKVVIFLTGEKIRTRTGRMLNTQGL